MTRYTDHHGNQIIMCDLCRQDISHGNLAFTLSPGVIKDAYFSKDYDKSELLLCPTCTRTVGHILTLANPRPADNRAFELLEAA